MAVSAVSDTYKQTIRDLSDRIVEAQRPIRILDAIKWDSSVEQAFFDSGCSELPLVDAAYYGNKPPGFDPAAKRKELHDIERDITRSLGQYNPVGLIMTRMCREYRMVVRMIEARGTADFSSLSQELYGSATDVFHAGEPTLADLGVMMSSSLTNIDKSLYIEEEPKTIEGAQAVEYLEGRLAETFASTGAAVRVMLSDGIVADAAAGSDYIKIRKEARFNARDLKLLEIHEGWVHLGTTINGRNQPVCTFLSKGPPSSTITQEGLALFMEIITFTSHPARLRRITNRIQAVHQAEQGATFIDVFRFFRDQGFGERESFTNTSRVYRGSTPTGGPFTKDLSYSKGFILVYNYICLAVRQGKLGRIPMLFCGKTTLEDVKVLSQLVEEGIVEPPKFLPPQFSDINALTAWMCYSNFLNVLNLKQIETDYAGIL